MSLLLSHLVEFGPYVFDFNEGRLRRGTESVDLPPRSVAVLSYLIQNRDHTVSREELKSNLWPDIHIEPNSIHKQVSDLRLALGDEAVFIETQYKKGWRFIADVKVASPAIELPLRDPVAIAPIESAPVPVRKRWTAVGTVALIFAVLCMGVVWMVLTANDGKVTVVKYQQLTNDGSQKRGPLLSDGKQIFFAEEATGSVRVVSIPVAGGEPTPLPLPSGTTTTKTHRSYGLTAISADRRTLLIQSAGPEGPSLWTVPAGGGEPKRLMGVLGAADWSPDGRTLAVAANQADELSFRDAQSLATSSSIAVGGSIKNLRWSPDGKRVRLTVLDKPTETASIWEAEFARGAARKLISLSGREPFLESGAWSEDGRYFFYQAGSRLQQDLWAVSDVREGSGNGFGGQRLPEFLSRLGASSRVISIFESKPIALTQGMGSWESPASLPDGSGIAAIRRSTRAEFASFDKTSGTWRSLWDHAPAYELDYSRDGNWVVFTRFPDHTIWKCRTDGTARTQITDSSVEGHQPHWSPDGRKIAFMGKTRTGQWRVNVVSADGGSREELLPTGGDQGVPTWSGDGRYIVLGDLLGRSEGPKMSIHVMDVATRDVADVENSHGLWSPRWSPNGKVIAAVTCDSTAIRIRDWPVSEAPGKGWKEIARMQYLDNATWSADSKYLYFNGHQRTSENWIYRVDVATSKVEELADLKDFSLAQEGWFGVSPQGALLAARGISTEEIWALKLQLK